MHICIFESGFWVELYACEDQSHPRRLPAPDPLRAAQETGGADEPLLRARANGAAAGHNADEDDGDEENSGAGTAAAAATPKRARASRLAAGGTGSGATTTFLERSRFIPLRLSADERRLLHLLEAALSVSAYTDKARIYQHNISATPISGC